MRSLSLVFLSLLFFSYHSSRKMVGNINSVASPKGTEVFPKEKPCKYAYSFKITFNKKVGEHLQSEALNEVMKYRQFESYVC